MLDGISGKTELIALFGDPVAHSRSPKMQNAAFSELGLDYAYLAFRIPEGEIGRAVDAARALGMRGCNVTMPHKQAVIAHLDGVDGIAGVCGAVNTVVNKDGVLTGYNTDAAGAVYALRKMGVVIGGSKAVILGMGGAGKAVAAGLADSGCRYITAAIRNASEARTPGTKANAHAEFLRSLEKTFPGLECRVVEIGDESGLKQAIMGSDLLINATDLGMGKNAGLSPVSGSEFFHRDLYVMDVVYDPEETEFLRMARGAGVKQAVNGLNMLLGQGIEAFRLFTGEDMPVEIARNALEKD